MNSTIMAELLERAKMSLRVSTSAFDEEIMDIINAGIDVLKTRGVTIDIEHIRPMETRALMTYVKSQFGEPENPEKIKHSFNEQLAQLMTTSGYTKWSE